jgi:hypothetical protein
MASLFMQNAKEFRNFAVTSPPAVSLEYIEHVQPHKEASLRPPLGIPTGYFKMKNKILFILKYPVEIPIRVCSESSCVRDHADHVEPDQIPTLCKVTRTVINMMGNKIEVSLHSIQLNDIGKRKQLVDSSRRISYLLHPRNKATFAKSSNF